MHRVRRAAVHSGRSGVQGLSKYLAAKNAWAPHEVAFPDESVLVKVFNSENIEDSIGVVKRRVSHRKI